MKRDNHQDENTEDVMISGMVSALVNLSRWEEDRLNNLTYGEFISKTNTSRDVLCEKKFEELVLLAHERLRESGYCHKKTLKLGAGTYIVVGDSHGKHTKTKMFDLLKQVRKHIGATNIIHVGHILDDDNVISYWWRDFPELIVLTKLEEQAVVSSQQEEWETFDIVREEIKLGNLSLRNQDLISDYVRTYISTLDQHIFKDSMICNSHRHEWHSRCSFRGNVFTVTPGCLCEQHIVRTIKQIDFTSGYQVKLAKAEGFVKYRRMRDMYRFWEQGLLVVNVNEQGEFSITPCRIFKVNGTYATAYFDKVITEDGIVEPDMKVFINTDHHCDKFDGRVLAVQDKIVEDFKPDIYVNLGDMQNNHALNHHILEKGGIITKSIVEENASVSYLLMKMAKWAPLRYLMYGNHERFVKDFYGHNPQLEDLLIQIMGTSLDENDYQSVDHKEVLELGGVKCIHGDMLMYGQTGSLLEKTSRTFGDGTVIGHLHTTAIRFGCYMLGMSGNMRQGYNEPNASNWVHGCGLCVQYGGQSWIMPLTFENYKVMVNNRTYTATSEEAWRIPKFNFKVSYSFEN